MFAKPSTKQCRFSPPHRPGGRRQGGAIGNYIVDFCAPRRKLIIELDGNQHLEQEEYDAQRTEFLESRGYKVLRFWNYDVLKNIDDVIREIQRTLKIRGNLSS